MSRFLEKCIDPGLRSLGRLQSKTDKLDEFRGCMKWPKLYCLVRSLG